MHMHFIFLTLCLCLAVFTSLELTTCLCLFSIWKGLIQFPFLRLSPFQLDLTGSHLHVSILTVCIIFCPPLGFRDYFGFLSHLLQLSFLFVVHSFITHSSINQSTTIYSVPTACQSLIGTESTEVFINICFLFSFKVSSWVSWLSTGN